MPDDLTCQREAPYSLGFKGLRVSEAKTSYSYHTLILPLTKSIILHKFSVQIVEHINADLRTTAS